LGRFLLEPIELARSIAEWVGDKKGENIVLTDLRLITTLADYFLICEAPSDRQINAITENIRENGKIAYDLLPLRVEGKGDSGWVLMDYGRVVVHIFSPDMRRYYDLENLWNEAQVLLKVQ
jgi:ribosome-associated protein